MLHKYHAIICCLLTATSMAIGMMSKDLAKEAIEKITDESNDRNEEFKKAFKASSPYQDKSTEQSTHNNQQNLSIQPTSGLYYITHNPRKSSSSSWIVNIYGGLSTVEPKNMNELFKLGESRYGSTDCMLQQTTAQKLLNDKKITTEQLTVINQSQHQNCNFVLYNQNDQNDSYLIVPETTANPTTKNKVTIQNGQPSEPNQRSFFYIKACGMLASSIALFYLLTKYDAVPTWLTKSINASMNWITTTIKIPANWNFSRS